MIKLIGFLAMSGEITSKTSGEVILWSNRMLRYATDEDMQEGEFGLAVGERKMKSANVKKSLNLPDTATEEELNIALAACFNKQIEFTFGRTKDGFDITGFKVLDKVNKS